MTHAGTAVDRALDCLGLFCPMPILGTREAIRELEVGQLLERRADEPATEAHMRSWARRTGHDLVAVTRDGPVYRFLVRKTR